MPSDTPREAFLPVLLVRASGHLLALPRRDVAEILPLPRLTALPGAPPILRGAFHLGEEVVLVLRLAALLGLAEPAEGDPLYHHLLLLADAPGRSRVALLADRVMDLATVEPKLLPPGDSFNDCVEGDIRLDAALVPLLTAGRLMTRYEAHRLDAFAARAAAREAAFTAGGAG